MQLKIWHKMIIGIAIPSFIVLLGGFITSEYISDVKNRQSYVQIADDLIEHVLEVRRNERNFLYFKNRESLDHLHDSLQTFTDSIHNTSEKTVNELGEKDFFMLRGLISSYPELINNLLKNYELENKIVAEVRTEGRKLEDYVAHGDHAGELTTSLVLHLRLLEKNYMLFRDKMSYSKLTDGLGSLKDFIPFCNACTPYSDAIHTLISAYNTSDLLMNKLQVMGNYFEDITKKIALRERERINSFLDKTKLLLVIALIILCTSGPLFVYKTATYIVAPIKRLADIAREIARGDTTVRAPLREHDETYELSQSFNMMLDKLQLTHDSLERSMELLKEKQAQLVESEKLASLGLLVSGVAHELNNPLNNISLIAERIVEEKDELSIREMKDMNNILSQCERAKHIVENLLDFARARKSTVMEKLDIVKVATEAFNLVGNQLRINNIDLQKIIPVTPLYIEGNRSKLEQILVSIMTNAIQAIQSDGSIKVEITTDTEAGTVLISISDTGPGIPETGIKHIFEPFYTTKPVGKGTGLGLSVAYSLAKEHNGDIQVESEDGKGSTFTIILPLYREVS